MSLHQLIRREGWLVNAKASSGCTRQKGWSLLPAPTRKRLRSHLPARGAAGTVSAIQAWALASFTRPSALGSLSRSGGWIETRMGSESLPSEGRPLAHRERWWKRVLERLGIGRGLPRPVIQSDNAGNLPAALIWAYERGGKLQFNPCQASQSIRFPSRAYSRLREECS